MTAVGYHTAAAPIPRAFARKVERLRWSNGRLTRAVRTLAKKLEGLSTLATPNLCGDIEGWVASGYTTLSASTTAFNRSYSAVDPEAEEVPLIINLAEPYSTPSDFMVLRHVELLLEAQPGEAEAHGVKIQAGLMNRLEAASSEHTRSSVSSAGSIRRRDGGASAARIGQHAGGLAQVHHLWHTRHPVLV